VKRIFLLLVVAAAVSPAAVINLFNQGFETGDLSGWTATGSVSAVGPTVINQWTVTPAGSYMARLDSNGVLVSDLETFFGLNPGTLVNGLPAPGGEPTNGAGIYQDFAGNAGDTVSMYWAYVARDYNPFNDPAFAVIIGPGDSQQVTVLASIYSGGITVGNYGATGWHAFTYELPSTGNYRLGFGVANTLDTALDGALFLDNAAGGLSGGGEIPEPGTFFLLGAGLAAAAFLRRR
jgi:hypothetical protein